MPFCFFEDFKRKTVGKRLAERKNTYPLTEEELYDTTAIYLIDEDKILLNLKCLNIFSIYGEDKLIKEVGISLLHENIHKALRGDSKCLRHYRGEEKIIKEICDEVRKENESFNNR